MTTTFESKQRSAKYVQVLNSARKALCLLMNIDQPNLYCELERYVVTIYEERKLASLELNLHIATNPKETPDSEETELQLNLTELNRTYISLREIHEVYTSLYIELDRIVGKINTRSAFKTFLPHNHLNKVLKRFGIQIDNELVHIPRNIQINTPALFDAFVN
jgi:hypothetical protein